MSVHSPTDSSMVTFTIAAQADGFLGAIGPFALDCLYDSLDITADHRSLSGMVTLMHSRWSQSRRQRGQKVREPLMILRSAASVSFSTPKKRAGRGGGPPASPGRDVQWKVTR
ncbi:MAG: hypothetical protein ACE5JJ_12400, partial [Nitrospinota bacterium]